MAEISERLRDAARMGSPIRLKALLRETGCDALSQDAYGVTALMEASLYGHEGCVQLLLPVSNALTQDEKGWTALMGSAASGHEGCVGLLLPASDTFAQDEDGLTASMWARNCKHESLAQWIDAYAQAQSERADFGVATGPGTPRGRAAFRM